MESDLPRTIKPVNAEPRTQAAPSPNPPAASLGWSGTKAWGQTLSQTDVLPLPILFWRGPLPGGPAASGSSAPSQPAYACRLRAPVGLYYGLSLVACQGEAEEWPSSRYSIQCRSQKESRMLSLPCKDALCSWPTPSPCLLVILSRRPWQFLVPLPSPPPFPL